MDLDYGEGKDAASKEDSIFVSPARAAQRLFSGRRWEQHAYFSLSHGEMFDVCKRAAARLATPWPTKVETTREETAPWPRVQWSNLSLSSQSCWRRCCAHWEIAPTAAGARFPEPCPSTWGDGGLGIAPHASDGATHRSPPSPPAVGDVLQESQPAVRLQSFSFCADWKDVEGAALSARTFNVLSMLTAYQVKLYEDFAWTLGYIWGNTSHHDFCLHIQCCVAEAMGKALGTMVLQERAWWLNLASLSERDVRCLWASWTCPLSWRVSLARHSPPCSCGARLHCKRRRMKHPNVVFWENSQLLLNQCGARSSCQMPSRYRLSRFQSTQNHCPKQLLRPAEKAGQRATRIQLQPHHHSLCKVQLFSPERKGREQPDRHPLHRWCCWKFPILQLLWFGVPESIQGPPGPCLLAAMSRARVRRDGRTLDGRGLSDCPPRVSTCTHTHIVFMKKKKLKVVPLPHSGQIPRAQL